MPPIALSGSLICPVFERTGNQLAFRDLEGVIADWR